MSSEAMQLAELNLRRRPDFQRILGVLVMAVFVGLGLWGLSSLDFNVENIAHSVDQAERIMSQMDPISLPPFGDLVYLIGLTLGICVLGTLLAALLSVPVAIFAAENTAPVSWLRMPARGIGVLCRAVPDVVLALGFAMAFNLGSAIPGILALGIHSIGMISKLFADAIEQIDRGPQLALRATGASRAQQFWSGVFPQVVPSWIATILHRLDINLRGSAILGYAGVGGLGYAMMLAFQDFPAGYGRGLGIAAVIFVLCVVVELISSAIRARVLNVHGRRAAKGSPTTGTATVDLMMRRPWTGDRVRTTVWQLAALIVIIGSVFASDIKVSDLDARAFGEVIVSFWPPNTGTYSFAEFGEALLVTIQIAAAATLLSLVVSLIIGALAARNVAPGPRVRTVARVLLVLFRGVPELVLAIFLIMITGLGAQAGVVALAFGGVGLLGKLVADGLEEIPAGPQTALTTVGASRGQRFAAATWPLGLPSVIGSTLYTFDTNIRSATLLGIVGAGGVGFYLTNASKVMITHGQVTTLVAMVVVTVLAVEALAAWMRRVFS